MPSRFTRLVLSTTLLLFAMGHGDGCGCGGDEATLGPPTEAVCPPGSTLTYANFGQQFMETFCTRCHSSALTGAARMEAPAYHDYDTLEGIRAVAVHIDQTTGSGPAATNESMPPGGLAPGLADRQKLSEWLACGTPQ